jgi:uncharacterized Zn-binding protein involved in type VI secretion
MKTRSRRLALFFAALMTISMITVKTGSAAPAVTLTKQTVKLNNKNVAISGYNIDGSNFFKLRDVALTLSTTAARFSIEYDAGTNTMWLRTGGYYVAQGGELAPLPKGDSLTVIPSSTTIYIDGKKVTLTAYNINGNNYFKLRDLGEAMDFGVAYEKEKDAVVIDGDLPYYAANLMNVLPKAVYDDNNQTIYFLASDAGNITVTKYSGNMYDVTGRNLTEARGIPLLKDTIGVFTGSPQMVMDALERSKNQGKITLEQDGKSFECIYSGSEYRLTISW